MEERKPQEQRTGEKPVLEEKDLEEAAGGISYRKPQPRTYVRQSGQTLEKERL